MPHAHMAAGASAHLGHTFSSFTVPDRGDNLRYIHKACICHPTAQPVEHPGGFHTPRAPRSLLPCTSVGRLCTVGAGRRSGFLLSENSPAPRFSTVELQATPQHVAEFTGHLQKPLARANALYSSIDEQISV